MSKHCFQCLRKICPIRFGTDRGNENQLPSNCSRTDRRTFSNTLSTIKMKPRNEIACCRIAIECHVACRRRKVNCSRVFGAERTESRKLRSLHAAASQALRKFSAAPKNNPSRFLAVLPNLSPEGPSAVSRRYIEDVRDDERARRRRTVLRRRDEVRVKEKTNIKIPRTFRILPAYTTR